MKGCDVAKDRPSTDGPHLREDKGVRALVTASTVLSGRALLPRLLLRPKLRA